MEEARAKLVGSCWLRRVLSPRLDSVRFGTGHLQSDRPQTSQSVTKGIPALMAATAFCEHEQTCLRTNSLFNFLTHVNVNAKDLGDVLSQMQVVIFRKPDHNMSHKTSRN